MSTTDATLLQNPQASHHLQDLDLLSQLLTYVKGLHGADALHTSISQKCSLKSQKINVRHCFLCYVLHFSIGSSELQHKHALSSVAYGTEINKGFAYFALISTCGSEGYRGSSNT